MPVAMPLRPPLPTRRRAAASRWWRAYRTAGSPPSLPGSTPTRVRHVAVNREESAIGLCSGAFFSGIGGLALMGASGFLTCISAITKINYTYQIPLLIGITLRGRPGDDAKFHQSNGLYLEPVIGAIDMPFVAIERGADITRLAIAFRHSRVMARPVVVGFTREVLRGEA
jgi:sulfopyruvate decarboxylase subunit alpha